MGRRQAWPGQVLGKTAIELSKKKIIVKELYFGEQPKQKQAGAGVVPSSVLARRRYLI